MKKIIIISLLLILLIGCKTEEPCKITIYSDGEVIFSSNCDNPNNLTLEIDLSGIPDSTIIENATFHWITK